MRTPLAKGWRWRRAQWGDGKRSGHRRDSQFACAFPFARPIHGAARHILQGGIREWQEIGINGRRWKINMLQQKIALHERWS
jgi:hypothetical protein